LEYSLAGGCVCLLLARSGLLVEFTTLSTGSETINFGGVGGGALSAVSGYENSEYALVLGLLSAVRQGRKE
jgi:hypothetical protein